MPEQYSKDLLLDNSTKNSQSDRDYHGRMQIRPGINYFFFAFAE